MALNPQSRLPLFTHQNFTQRNKMLGASVDILDQLLELSVTGDTAKYLVFNSAEVVHFHHQTQQTQTILKHSNCAKEKERVETRLFRSIFPSHTDLTRSHSNHSTTTCQVGTSPRNLIHLARAHMTNGCTVSNFTQRNIGPFNPGWQSTSE